MYEKREIDLNSYFPDYLKGIKEFQTVAKLEENEIRKLYESSNGLWNNGFIATSDYQGMKKWESLLGIAADSTLTIDERRNAIMTKWNFQLPYTDRKLKEQLTSLLNDSYVLSIDPSDYELKLVIKEQTMAVVNSIQNMIKEMIPANLYAVFYSQYQGGSKVRAVSENQIFLRTSFYPRFNLPHLCLDHVWYLNGSRKLSGFNKESLIDFYPAKTRLHTEILNPNSSAEQLKVTTKMDEQIHAEQNKVQIQTGLKNDLKANETVLFRFHIKEGITAGPVSITNRNVLEQEWDLDGSRSLNGGITIL